jgi:hypothetical protein
MAQEESLQKKLVSKIVIAARYGVSTRTINTWMHRRILPHVKLSHKMVRFDPEACDVVMQSYEEKSIFDQAIREELGRRLAERGGKPFGFQKELGIDPIHPPGGEADPSLSGTKQ